jgi:hypothetical protein
MVDRVESKSIRIQRVYPTRRESFFDRRFRCALFVRSNHSYAQDLLPPPPYQNFHGVANGKSTTARSPVSKKHSSHSARRSHRHKSHVESQPAAVYRLEGTKESLMNLDELSSVFAHVKHSHPNKKIVVYKTSTTPQTHEFHQLVDEMCSKHGVELKHSQHSPFQHYRSQSLQDLTSTSNNPLLTPRDFDYQFQPIEKHDHIRMNYSKY